MFLKGKQGNNSDGVIVVVGASILSGCLDPGCGSKDPVHSVDCFVNTYPLKSDSSGGQRYSPFDQLELAWRERHCESEAECLAQEHNDPSQRSKPALTIWPARISTGR